MWWDENESRTEFIGKLRWYVRAVWKWAAGFVTGLILGLTLLNLIQARAEQEIIVDFTTAPASLPGPEELRSS